MNAFQPCSNISDLVPLYLAHQIYLKPIARLNISLQLPNVKKLGKSVSHWEIMDKIRDLIKPDEFTVLKVTKTTVEFVRFEAEVETKAKLDKVVSRIDNKMIKLKDFSDLMRIRACEWKSNFPNRRVWDDFFQNMRDMDEMKAGERPDTAHLSNLPTKWFIPYHLSEEEDVTPSEKVFYRIFEKFGSIRYVDIPICDPYRKKMKEHISGLKNSSFDKTEFFEGYVQFKDYIGFTKTMDALRDMKLVRKEDDSATEVNIKVDFDRSKHLSDASIRRREIVRERLVKKAHEKEEKEKAELEEKKRKAELERQKQVDLKAQKESRRKLREEKRKAKILQKLEVTGTDEINEKIAKEEKKLLKVQRKLEAIRLVEELFSRIKEKNPEKVQTYERIPNSAYNELKRFKNASELEVLNQREKLHHAVKGRVMLKSILSEGTKVRKYSSSSESSLSLEEVNLDRRPRSPVLEKYPELLYNPAWLGYPYQLPSGPMYGDYADHFALRGFMPRGRTQFPRLPIMPGPSRENWLDGLDINPFSKEISFINMCTRISESILAEPGVQELIYSNETFDLVLAEIFGNEAHFAFAPHFKSKLIVFSSLGLSDWSSHLIGNIRLPSITAHIFLPLTNTMDFFQRLKNTAITFWNSILKTLFYFPKQQELIDTYFPYHMDLDEVINNVSLVLMNSHVSTSEATTLTNAAIEIGGFHVVARKLPRDIEKFLDEAKYGAVLFSMGSNVKSKYMPKEKLKDIIEAIAKMKQRVLWKYEEDNVPNKPDNLLISKWLPQRGILAHPNVVAFISHGGLLSMTEAVHFGVPVIGIPIFGDQKMNVAKGVKRGTTILLPYVELNGKSLHKAVEEITEKEQYKRNAKKYSAILRDQVVKPMDLAMHWVEHVLQYGGSHLRNSSLDLYWFQLYLLDVLVFTILCLALLNYSVKFIWKILCFEKVVDSRKVKKN